MLSGDFHSVSQPCVSSAKLRIDNRIFVSAVCVKLQIANTQIQIVQTRAALSPNVCHPTQAGIDLGSRATYAGTQLAVAAAFFGCHLATATPGGTWVPPVLVAARHWWQWRAEGSVGDTAPVKVAEATAR